MKMRFFCLISVVLATCSGFADSYTLNLPAGSYRLIANHLDAAGGNTLNNILPNPPPGTIFYKWSCGNWNAYQFDPDELVWSPDGNATLNPGEGALINLPAAATITFTGTPHVPVLPVVLPCGCNQTNLLSRQTTDAPTTFQDLTGFDPTEGTMLFRHTAGPGFPIAPPNYTVYTFSGGAWAPSIPMLNLGESAFIYVPCATNSCITLIPPLDKSVECGRNWTFDQPVVYDTCCGNNVNVTIFSTTGTNVGSCTQINTRTWRATDCSNYTAFCSQTVTVTDTTPPMITCAPNKMIAAGASWSFDPPTAVDVCCGANVTISVENTTTSGICPQVITRTWRAYDCCSNSASCSQVVTVLCPLKWDQPPDPAHPTNIFYGWNEISMYNDRQIAADDWVCTNYAPVTDVHWWGSFNHWCDSAPPQLPDAFQIAFWTDVPTNAADLFSHPGVVLQTIWCTNYTWQFVGWDFDPIRNTYEACFRFDQFLTPDEYFYQYPLNGTNVYWISIAAVYTNQPTQYPWGWKTRPRRTNSLAPDDAVRIYVPTVLQPGTPYQFGEALWWPTPTNSWDLAFELTSGWATNLVTKWEQLPDLSTDGIDVNASDQPSMGPPNLLASDFLCNSTGPLTDITIWASWLNDLLPGGSPDNVAFTLSIHSDIPVSPTNPYSQPGPMLWMQTFIPGQFTSSVYAAGLVEGWLDPPGGYVPFGDTVCYQYNFPVDPATAFVQTNGNIYWLDVQAVPWGSEPARLGWKTSITNWNDDSVWASAKEPWPGPWMELRRIWEPPPPAPPRSIDLAFRLRSEQMVEGIKWSQPPVRYNPTNAFNGWNEFSVYGSSQIVADDWVCTGTNPVTDIHWWGSFLNWCEAFPPQIPDAFHITIWTDVPTNADNSFSHPGVVIWETHCTNFTWESAGFDFDPRAVTGLPRSAEACFKFTQYLTESEWFYQNSDQRTNIYWISIAAVYTNPTYQYPWGWKSRPRDPNSLAPDDAVRINDPTLPTIGKPYSSGSPIFWPDSAHSWDMAFQLTTHPNQPPPPTNTVAQKWLQIPDTGTNGLDVKVTDPKILADDFLCTATGPITQVRIWGSWRYDVVPPVATPPCFSLGLWTDVPVSPTNAFSRPGDQLCNWSFGAFQYTNFVYADRVDELFFDPNVPGIIGSDTVIWEYVFDLTNFPPCWQTNGNIYWLSVQADCMDTNSFLFGWKTCPTNWNDDAAFGDSPGFGAPPPFWYELRRPPYFTNSLDLAFEVITETNPCPPVSIICGTNLVVECGTSWTIPLPVVSSPCCGTNYTLTRTLVTNGTCPQIITFTWQVIDCAGYIASCSQTVTIVDTTPPVLTCATNKTMACGSAWSFDPPTAYDLCCGTNVTISVLNTVTNGCQATRTWLATDCCTNSINCSQTVTINDTNPPTITCPSNIVVLTCSTNIAVIWSITATDLCSSVTVTSSPPSGALFNRDTTNTVTAVATDACGNSSTCTFLVTVRRPSLSISIGGSPVTVTITWADGGVLQEATNVAGGTWTDLPLATSPYSVTPSASPRFYRLRCP